MVTLFPHGRNLIRRCFSSLRMDPVHVCVVGSGPAGFYTAEKMLKAYGGAKVDILDRLPTPFGLVRSGVAPDHPETKVVLAYGAESDRSLGIPGEELGGIHSAREFVWWYNGHPDCHSMTPELKNTDSAVVLGQGNVALDVARILLRPTNELAITDIAEHAFLSLHESTIRKVYLVGRRGPAQAACTAKELREILGIKDLSVHINEVDLCISPADEEELKSSRIQRRVYDLLLKAASSQHPHTTAGGRELHFVFFRKPDRFLPSENGCSTSGVRLEKTSLKENGSSGKQLAVGMGQYEDLKCGLIFKSIGYKSVPVDGLPFDTQRGVVPNNQGRVLSSAQPDHATLEHGLYVAGWLKRGPTGIIATNLYCAEETVGSISEDIEKGLLAPASSTPKPGRQALLQALEDRNVRFVPFSGWQKIDSKERMEGNLRNKPRAKIVLWDELLRAANE